VSHDTLTLFNQGILYAQMLHTPHLDSILLVSSMFISAL
jgi:hypothetical protein